MDVIWYACLKTEAEGSVRWFLSHRIISLSPASRAFSYFQTILRARRACASPSHSVSLFSFFFSCSRFTIARYANRTLGCLRKREISLVVYSPCTKARISIPERERERERVERAVLYCVDVYSALLVSIHHARTWNDSSLSLPLSLSHRRSDYFHVGGVGKGLRRWREAVSSFLVAVVVYCYGACVELLNLEHKTGVYSRECCAL